MSFIDYKSINALSNNKPSPHIDVKQSTVNGALKRIINDFYTDDIFDGVTGFYGQVLRVNQNPNDNNNIFLKSFYSLVGIKPASYKVRVFDVDIAKPPPKTFDENEIDKAIINFHSDAGFENQGSEVLSVGDFVFVTYGNLVTKTDIKILRKLANVASGESTAPAASGSTAPAKSPESTQDPKTAFTQTPPAVNSADFPNEAFVKVVEEKGGTIIVERKDGSVIKITGVSNQRTNNPGNVEYGDFAIANGAIGRGGAKNRFAVFPTKEMGLNALKQLLFIKESKYLNLSIKAATYRYAPPTENPTDIYVKALTKKINKPDTTLLRDLNEDERKAYIEAIEKMEGTGKLNIVVLKEGSGTKLA
jgi:hypothetical protein